MTSDYDDMYGVIGTDIASGGYYDDFDIEFTQTSSTSATLFALDANCNLYVTNSAGGGFPAALCAVIPDAFAPSLVRCEFSGAEEATKTMAFVTCSFYPEILEAGLGSGGSLMCTAGDLAMAVQSLEVAEQGAQEIPEGSLNIGAETVNGACETAVRVGVTTAIVPDLPAGAW